MGFDIILWLNQQENAEISLVSNVFSLKEPNQISYRHFIFLPFHPCLSEHPPPPSDAPPSLLLPPLSRRLSHRLPRVVFGNSNGLAVVDYIQKTVVLNLGTVELYGSNDPYQRQPRSPRKTRQPSGGNEGKRD